MLPGGRIVHYIVVGLHLCLTRIFRIWCVWWCGTDGWLSLQLQLLQQQLLLSQQIILRAETLLEQRKLIGSRQVLRLMELTG